MLRRGIVMLVVVVLALTAGMRPAYAHAIVVRTVPPDGAELSVGPKQINLWFTEPVVLNLTTIDLVDSRGQHISVGAVHSVASQALAIGPADAATTPILVVVDLPALGPNAYRFSWHTVSNADLHVTVGTIVFGVQRPASQIRATVLVAAPPATEVLLRWLNFIVMATLFGALALALLIIPVVMKDNLLSAGRVLPTLQPSATSPECAALIIRVRARLLKLALWSTVLAFVAGIGLLLLQAGAARSATDKLATAQNIWRVIVGTGYGARWLLREGLIAALGATLLVLPRSTIRPAARCLVLAFVLALVYTQALQSHAAAFSGNQAVQVAADAVHLLTAGLWAGGLVALTITIVPLLQAGPPEAALATSILRRFGVLAAASLAILLMTGLYSAGLQVASLDAVLTTLYGRALLLKIGVVLCAGLIGLLNTLMLHPGLARHRAMPGLARLRPFTARHLRVSVMVEAVAAGAILLVAAILSSTQPARGPEFDPQPGSASAPAIISGQADDLFVPASVKPNRPGQNFVTLGIFNTRRPAPAPITQVQVRLRAPDEQHPSVDLEAVPLGDGHYQVSGDIFKSDGEWQVAIGIRRTSMAETWFSSPWTVLPSGASVAVRPVLLSNRPLAPWLTAAATALALLFALTLAGIVCHRQMPIHLATAWSVVSGQPWRRREKL